MNSSVYDKGKQFDLNFHSLIGRHFVGGPLIFWHFDRGPVSLGGAHVDFGDEVSHATDNPVDELSAPTETLTDCVPEGDTRFESETEGVIVVGTEPMLQPLEAYALVLGHRRLRVNSIQILQRSQAFQGKFSQIEIPLRRMITLQVVRPTLAKDIEKMKADFVHGYHPGAVVFYVSTTDFDGEERFVTDVDHLSSNVHWQRRDDEFESFLSLHSKLHELFNKFFSIWDGNHRHQVWTKFIAQSHSTVLRTSS